MPTWRTETATTGASGSTPTPTVPSGLADGDTALIALVVSATTTPPAAPSGFTQIQTSVAFTNPRVYVYRKAITNAAGETSWAFGGTLAAAYGVRAIAMASGDPTTPEDATPTLTETAATGIPISPPDITPGTAGGGIWSIVAANTSSRTIDEQTSPWTNGAEQGERKNQAAWRDSAGASAHSITWNFSGNATNRIAILVALKIAGAATPNLPPRRPLLTRMIHVRR